MNYSQTKRNTEEWAVQYRKMLTFFLEKYDCKPLIQTFDCSGVFETIPNSVVSTIIILWNLIIVKTMVLYILSLWLRDIQLKICWPNWKWKEGIDSVTTSCLNTSRWGTAKEEQIPNPEKLTLFEHENITEYQPVAELRNPSLNKKLCNWAREKIPNTCSFGE